MICKLFMKKAIIAVIDFLLKFKNKNSIIINVYYYTKKEKEELMSYVYKTQGTCATKIELELEGNIVHNVKFTGGCHGNLQAIPKLVEGMTIEEVEERISGIRCGFKNTSCGDQLAKACRAAYEAANN